MTVSLRAIATAGALTAGFTLNVLAADADHANTSPMFAPSPSVTINAAEEAEKAAIRSRARIMTDTRVTGYGGSATSSNNNQSNSTSNINASATANGTGNIGTTGSSVISSSNSNSTASATATANASPNNSTTGGNANAISSNNIANVTGNSITIHGEVIPTRKIDACVAAAVRTHGPHADIERAQDPDDKNASRFVSSIITGNKGLALMVSVSKNKELTVGAMDVRVSAQSPFGAHDTVAVIRMDDQFRIITDFTNAGANVSADRTMQTRYVTQQAVKYMIDCAAAQKLAMNR